MRNNILSALLLSVLLIISCRKDTEIIPQPNYNDNHIYSSINYTAICSHDVDKDGNIIKHIAYDGYGDFHSNTQYGEVNIGTLYIGNIRIEPDPAYPGLNDYRFSISNKNDSNNAKQFGTDVIFKISGGSDYNQVSQSMYVPKEIFLDTVRPAFPNLFAEVSSSNLPYRVRWNADANNENGVGLVIKYNGTISRKINPALSDTVFTKVIPTLPDNGYYDVTASDLANIPTGGIIDIFIVRSNWGVMTSNGKTINIMASTNSTRSYMLVQ